MSNEIDLDRTPTTIIGGTRYPMIRPDADDHSPMLPARNAQQTIQAILAQPAPVPTRRIETIERERLLGDNAQSTPVGRAIASAIKSGKYLAIVAVVGLVAYVAIPSVSGAAVTFVTLIAMAIVMLVFDAMEYKHSQPGVERLRSKQDHRVDLEHERNRHLETMTAIEGDIEIKLKVLDYATGYKRLVDKKRGDQ